MEPETKYTPADGTIQDYLKDINFNLLALVNALMLQNRILQSCILTPEDGKPRFMTGSAGALEVITL